MVTVIRLHKRDNDMKNDFLSNPSYGLFSFSFLLLEKIDGTAHLLEARNYGGKSHESLAELLASLSFCYYVIIGL